MRGGTDKLMMEGETNVDVGLETITETVKVVHPPADFENFLHAVLVNWIRHQLSNS